MELLVGIAILVFSAIMHEIAHGLVADKLGDPTARVAGRLTLNPLPHIDPIMSILVPVMMFIATQGQFVFGAAKPVPVNPLMLREGRKDLALVALAGPLTNLLIAIVAALCIQFLGNVQFLFLVVIYNLTLGFLNLIPIPPLDGSKFFSIILPTEVAQKYLSLAPFGIFILFFLLISTPIGDFLRILVERATILLIRM